MLQILQNVSQMTVGAGEPIVFEYQPASSAGVPDALANRAVALAIFDKTTNEQVLYADGNSILDVNDPRFVWAFDGTVSRGLYGKQNLAFNLVDRDQKGFEVIAQGSFTVTQTAPNIANFGSAQIARYVTRIQRRNDPETLAQPVFRVSIALFQSAVVIPPVSPPSLNFSVATNSGYLAFI